ncbi:MAG TPA: nuclear transport factor 2 family protein [Terriglobales bacterium]|nr:nuclear transport factor 2 family protein [Terriglobales bacterium]
MKRREVLKGSAAIVLGAAVVPLANAADQTEAIKQVIRSAYDAFSDLDKQKYRTMLTDDYLLLEDGALLDIDGDIALMPSADIEYKRTDEFDFRTVKIHGDTAYAVYFLKSDSTEKKNGSRSRKYLESAILRRSGNTWKLALLHSTKVKSAALRPVSEVE